MLAWRRLAGCTSRAMSGPLLTLLAMPKPFDGHIGIIQRNAITSWTKLNPRPEIFLFGEERGTAEIAAELQIGHLRDIQRNEFGTPLLNDLFQRAKAVVKTAMLGYVNCDIIVLQEFQDSVAAIHEQFAQFLAVTHRLEIDLRKSLDFNTDGPLHLGLLPVGVRGHHTAIDAFVFTRDVYPEVPSLAIGRAWFDQWLIKDALLHGVPVVDITQVARAIHQNHDYAHIAGGQRGAYGGEEARRNLEIYGGEQHAYTLLNATHELRPDHSLRRVRYRPQIFHAKQWLWRNFVQRTAPFRRRLGLSRSIKP
jgi:hypothetical protein